MGNIRFSFLFSTVALLCGSAFGIDYDVALRGSWPPQPVGLIRNISPEMAAAGRLVFLANGGETVEVIDFSDFSRAKSFAGVAGSGVRCVKIDSKILYVADDSPTLRTFDLSDPHSPQPTGFVPLKARPDSLSVANGFAYLASEEDGLQIVDVRDPAMLTWCGAIKLPGLATRVTATNGHAYVSSYQPGFDGNVYDVDVSTPSTPKIVGTFPSTRDVAVSGGLQFVLNGGGLVIYDISNSPERKLRGYLNGFSVPDDLQRMVVGDGVVYVSSWYTLYAIDVTDPDSPRMVGSYKSVDGNMYAVARSGAEVYLGTGARIEAIDMSEPTTPKVSGMYRRPSSFYKATMAGSFVYGIDYNGLPSGIDVIDVSNIANPVHVARVTTTRKAYSIDVVDDYGYVWFWDSFTRDAGMGIVDLKDPRNPRMITEGSRGEGYSQFRKLGNYALALGEGTLVTFDLSNPETPTRVRQYTTSATQKQLIREGTRAYVAADDGVRIYDVTDPLAIVALGIVPTNNVSVINGIAVRGNVLYVAGGTNGLVIFDVSKPEVAPILSRTPLFGTVAFGVAVHDDDAFVDSNIGGAVIDISNPARPVVKIRSPLLRSVLDVQGTHVLQLFNSVQTAEIVRANPQSMSQLATPGKSEDVAISGRYAYVAGAQSNIRVIDISDSRSPIKVAEVPVSAKRVMVRGKYLYAVDPYFNTIDISDPLHPVLKATLDEQVQGLVLSARYAFTMGAALAINITNAAKPFVVARNPIGVACMTASWPYVYYVNGLGLTVYDYRNVANPVQVAYLIGFTTASEFDVCLQGPYLYSVGLIGLHVTDVSNPAKPIWIGTESSVHGRRVWVVGQFAYVVDNMGALHVFDVSHPSRPRRVAGNANVNTLSSSDPWLARYGFGASGDTLYFASDDRFVITDVFRYDPVAVQLTALTPTLAGTSRLRVAGPAGLNIQLERSSDLKAWEPISSMILTDRPKDLLDGSDASERQFYRMTAP